MELMATTLLRKTTNNQRKKNKEGEEKYKFENDHSVCESIENYLDQSLPYADVLERIKTTSLTIFAVDTAFGQGTCYLSPSQPFILGS
jgi:hypothetical protein